MSDTASKTDWQAFQAKIKEVLHFLFEYFKNPIIGIRQLPNWGWPTIILFQIVLISIYNLLFILVEQSVSRALMGLFFTPIVTIFNHFVISGFFYYTFLFFYRRKVDFRQLYIIITLAYFPFTVLTIFSPLLKAANLVGLAITGFLLLVGLIEAFQLPKPSLTRFLVILYAVYVIMWVVNNLHLSKKEDTFRKMATPESLDILEKELKGK